MVTILISYNFKLKKFPSSKIGHINSLSELVSNIPTPKRNHHFIKFESAVQKIVCNAILVQPIAANNNNNNNNIRV